MSTPFDAKRLAEDMAHFSTQAGQVLATLRATQAGEEGAARDEVWRRGKVVLYRYRATARPLGLPPLLLVFALVNRPSILDFSPRRSLVRGLLAAGLDVYLIDWGYPDGTDRYLGFADYVDGYLDAAVQQILATHGIRALNLLGVCQGGTLALCHAALHGDAIANLVTMVTPVDFATPENLLARWAAGIDMALMAAQGNVPGQWLNSAYLALRPFRLAGQKYVDLVRSRPSPAAVADFLRMERWIHDSPDQPARFFREFTTWLYQENRLVAGRLELAGRPVRLDAITRPVLNIYGLRDHIVPPSASLPLGRHLGTRDYQALAVDAGHIGMYVSAGACATVPAAIVQWLSQRP